MARQFGSCMYVFLYYTTPRMGKPKVIALVRAGNKDEAIRKFIQSELDAGGNIYGDTRQEIKEGMLYDLQTGHLDIFEVHEDDILE